MKTRAQLAQNDAVNDRISVTVHRITNSAATGSNHAKKWKKLWTEAHANSGDVASDQEVAQFIKLSVATATLAAICQKTNTAASRECKEKIKSIEDSYKNQGLEVANVELTKLIIAYENRLQIKDFESQWAIQHRSEKNVASIEDIFKTYFSEVKAYQPPVAQQPAAAAAASAVEQKAEPTTVKKMAQQINASAARPRSADVISARGREQQQQKQQETADKLEKQRIANEARQKEAETERKQAWIQQREEKSKHQQAVTQRLHQEHAIYAAGVVLPLFTQSLRRHQNPALSALEIEDLDIAEKLKAPLVKLATVIENAAAQKGLSESAIVRDLPSTLEDILTTLTNPQADPAQAQSRVRAMLRQIGVDPRAINNFLKTGVPKVFSILNLSAQIEGLHHVIANQMQQNMQSENQAQFQSAAAASSEAQSEQPNSPAGLSRIDLVGDITAHQLAVQEQQTLLNAALRNQAGAIDNNAIGSLESIQSRTYDLLTNNILLQQSLNEMADLDDEEQALLGELLQESSTAIDVTLAHTQAAIEQAQEALFAELRQQQEAEALALQQARRSPEFELKQEELKEPQALDQDAPAPNVQRARSSRVMHISEDSTSQQHLDEVEREFDASIADLDDALDGPLLGGGARPVISAAQVEAAIKNPDDLAVDFETFVQDLEAEARAGIEYPGAAKQPRRHPTPTMVVNEAPDPEIPSEAELVDSPQAKDATVLRSDESAEFEMKIEGDPEAKQQAEGQAQAEAQQQSGAPAAGQAQQAGSETKVEDVVLDDEQKQLQEEKIESYQSRINILTSGLEQLDTEISALVTNDDNLTEDEINIMRSQLGGHQGSFKTISQQYQALFEQANNDGIDVDSISSAFTTAALGVQQKLTQAENSLDQLLSAIDDVKVAAAAKPAESQAQQQREAQAQQQREAQAQQQQREAQAQQQREAQAQQQREAQAQQQREAQAQQQREAQAQQQREAQAQQQQREAQAQQQREAQAQQQQREAQAQQQREAQAQQQREAQAQQQREAQAQQQQGGAPAANQQQAQQQRNIAKYQELINDLTAQLNEILIDAEDVQSDIEILDENALLTPQETTLKENELDAIQGRLAAIKDELGELLTEANNDAGLEEESFDFDEYDGFYLEIEQVVENARNFLTLPSEDEDEEEEEIDEAEVILASSPSPSPDLSGAAREMADSFAKAKAALLLAEASTNKSQLLDDAIVDYRAAAMAAQGIQNKNKFLSDYYQGFVDVANATIAALNAKKAMGTDISQATTENTLSLIQEAKTTLAKAVSYFKQSGQTSAREAQFATEYQYINNLAKPILNNVFQQADAAKEVSHIKALNTHLENSKIAHSKMGGDNAQTRQALHNEWDSKFKPLADQVTKRVAHLTALEAQLKRLLSTSHSPDETSKIEKKLKQVQEARTTCEATQHNLNTINQNINATRTPEQQEVGELKQEIERLAQRARALPTTSPAHAELATKKAELVTAEAKLATSQAALLTDIQRIQEELALAPDADVKKGLQTQIDQKQWALNTNQVELHADRIVSIKRSAYDTHEAFRVAIAEARQKIGGELPDTAPAAINAGKYADHQKVDVAKEAVVMAIGNKSKPNSQAIYTLEPGKKAEDFSITLDKIGKDIPEDARRKIAAKLVEEYINQNPGTRINITGTDKQMTKFMKEYCDAMHNLVSDKKEKKKYERVPDMDVSWKDKMSNWHGVSKMEDFIKKTYPDKADSLIQGKNVYDNKRRLFSEKLENRIDADKIDTVQKVQAGLEEGNKNIEEIKTGFPTPGR
ncbi:MAG: hypothetical protein P4M14_03815 [Gammaproteobacteria bacterium]|nr:hypothetical protein [Gammaproteobacteria bacterium]